VFKNAFNITGLYLRIKTNQNEKNERMMNKQKLQMVDPSKEAEVDFAIEVKGFYLWLRYKHILKDINLAFHASKISCIIETSGSGKSKLIRSINRINDENGEFTTEGGTLMENKSVFSKEVDVAKLRTEIGVVFPKKTVFS
jgi:phosphate transport system ATP-binding protein